MSKDERHRAWVFTINNWTDSDLFAAKNLLNGKVGYGIFGREIGPENGVPHLQGYVRFENAQTSAFVRKKLCRAHFAAANGSDIQNQKYCSKGESIYEVGEVSEQGKRNDILEVTQKIKNGEITLEECMFDYPIIYLKYSRSLEKMFLAVAKPRSTLPEVHWRWGVSGVGKTRYCVEKHPDHYIKDGTKWWDNYKTGQECIIFDDFVPSNFELQEFLRLTDRYKCQGQCKGGYIQINSPYIYITCQHPPSHYYGGIDLVQITRRCTSVEEIK